MTIQEILHFKYNIQCVEGKTSIPSKLVFAKEITTFLDKYLVLLVKYVPNSWYNCLIIPIAYLSTGIIPCTILIRKLCTYLSK